MSSPSALFPSGTPGVIASVSEHARRRGRYRVRLSDGREWLIEASAVSSMPSVREGTPLASEQVSALELAHRGTACLDRALGAMARARRSRRELEQRLRSHEPDADVIGRALDRLEALGLLNDEAVARAEAASRFQRGEGTGRVRQALVRKGIARRTVDAALSEVAGEEEVDDASLCRAAADKRLRALRSYAPEVQRRRLTGFLLRRGFHGGIVHDVVRTMLRTHTTDLDDESV